MDDNALHIITSPSKQIYVCHGIDFAKKIQSIFEGIFKEECKMMVAQGDVMYFDDGRLVVNPEDVVNVIIDNKKISFYIQDFSSLMFSLKSGLDSAHSSEVVFVHSEMRNLALEKSLAISLKDFLDAKYDIYKKRENDWFEKNGDNLELVTSLANATVPKKEKPN